MENFVPTKQYLREVILSNFVQRKTAAETYRFLVEVYGEHCPSNKTIEYWFRRFKSNDFDISDKERSGAPQKVKDEELEALLDVDSCQTEKELAIALNVTQQCISQRLHALGMIQKQGYWVPHKLTERQEEN